MRAQIRIHNDGRFTSNIDAVRADWDDRESKASRLTIYGKFPAEGCQFASTYVMHFRTDIAFSLCKKFEKEGVLVMIGNKVFVGGADPARKDLLVTADAIVD